MAWTARTTTTTSADGKYRRLGGGSAHPKPVCRPARDLMLGVIMGKGHKMKHAAESAKGKMKEKAGDATDNRDLQAEGQAEKTKGDLKQAGEKVKDAFKD
jgi:uncharacterized protein YjbJ (UPF0337 family)